MDVFCMAGVHQQPEQSNSLAEGQILTYKLSSGLVPLCQIVFHPADFDNVYASLNNNNERYLFLHALKAFHKQASSRTS